MAIYKSYQSNAIKYYSTLQDFNLVLNSDSQQLEICIIFNVICYIFSVYELLVHTSSDSVSDSYAVNTVTTAA